MLLKTKKTSVRLGICQFSAQPSFYSSRNGDGSRDGGVDWVASYSFLIKQKDKKKAA